MQLFLGQVFLGQAIARQAVVGLAAVLGGWLVGVGVVPVPTSGYDWPLQPVHPLVHPFQAPASRYGPGHRGADLAGVPGQAVLAAGAGVVTHSGVIAGRGTVTVRHANGWRTTYEPLDDRVVVGTVIRTGDRLGSLATQGHCGPQACLHWGLVISDDVYRDPLLLVREQEIILLPPR